MEWPISGKPCGPYKETEESLKTIKEDFSLIFKLLGVRWMEKWSEDNWQLINGQMEMKSNDNTLCYACTQHWKWDLSK